LERVEGEDNHYPQPFKINSKDSKISQLEEQLKENQASILEQSNSRHYDEQIQALQKNYESTLKKLDRVRNLVMDNALENLKRAIKRGEI
jgi:hypothetical protein